MIFNCVTQEFYGHGPQRYVSYDAVAECMKGIDSHAESILAEVGVNTESLSVALPMIGAGLGGGKWEIIKAIIEAEFTIIQPVVYTI